MALSSGSSDSFLSTTGLLSMLSTLRTRLSAARDPGFRRLSHSPSLPMLQRGAETKRSGSRDPDDKTDRQAGRGVFRSTWHISGITIRNFTVRFLFLTVRCDSVRFYRTSPLRTAPHRTARFCAQQSHKTATRRRIGKAKDPHRTAPWSSMGIHSNGVFPTMQIDRIRRKKLRAPYRLTVRTTPNLAVCTTIQMQKCRNGAKLPTN